LLHREWPDVFDAARRAEAFVHGDPRTSCFYARRTLELAALWGTTARRSKSSRRSERGARVGQQAKLYADCLKTQFGQRPVVFYSNGYEHWIWDDSNYPRRAIQGFYTKAELELIIRRRTSRKSLASVETPHGPEGLFTETAVGELVAVLDAVGRSASAA
jgi:hypothetical protein